MNFKNEELLTLDDLEKILKKGRTMIWKYRRDGKLNHYGMSGKSPLFRMADVEKFLTQSLNTN